jgi:hypothetical protein
MEAALPGWFVCLFEVGGDLRGQEEERFELFLEDGFKVGDGDFVPALIANIFRRIGGHIHFLAAAANVKPAKRCTVVWVGRLPFRRSSK